MINYQELKKLGLSDKEAKLYLTSLQRGPETAPTLAKLSDLVRPTAYVIIDGLVKKGLMSSTLKDKKTFFTAESPEHLLSLIRLQKKEIDEKERELVKLIPQLEQLANIKGEKPKVRVFEGKEGLQLVREQILKSKAKEVFGYVPVDEVYNLFSEKEHTEIMTKRRVAKKIRSKIFYTSKKGPILKRYDKDMMREAKYISDKEFPFKAGIDIYENNVAIYTFKGNIIGILIENQDIADTLKSIFEIAWKNVKDSDKK